jgi:putative Holliday junction resolvase
MRPKLSESPMPTTGRLFAMDWGEKRIGLATCDPLQKIAQPLATLVRRRGRRFPLKQLKTYLDSHRPVGIVIGLPLESDGHEGKSARAAREVGTLVQTKTGLPVMFWDERMSTARALRSIHDLEGSPRERRGDVDQLSATVILQTYLDARRS